MCVLRIGVHARYMCMGVVESGIIYPGGGGQGED